VLQQQKDKGGGGEALSWPMLLALAWELVCWVGGREGGREGVLPILFPTAGWSAPATQQSCRELAG
jgi:hypothetical protein